MTPEFKYAVVSTNVDGGRSTAKFINARSAHSWAKRLQEEAIEFEIYAKPLNVKLSLKELRTEASSEKKPTKRKYR